MTIRALGPLALVAWLLAAVGPAQAQAPSYLLFESGPVRPIALSPDGRRLFAVNTPDNHLEVFDVDGTGRLSHATSVPVGLEPVAVAARNDSEVWVVNHLSDSVSIVDLSQSVPRVVRTLLVGDEPNDIVFAGPDGNRAFVSCAHRGQNAPVVTGDYDLPGIGRADVYVYDATRLGSSLEGDRLTVITLFGDKPRALARSADGRRVYAAVFRSGNGTTIVPEPVVCDTSATNVTDEIVEGPCTVGSGANQAVAPGGKPTPHKNHPPQSVQAPETGLIVKKNRDGASPGAWQDELGRDWSDVVKFDLSDQDVFTIAADADPVPVEVGTPFSGVGTILFNMVTHPVSGAIYVSNTDAGNHVRFEGPGDHVVANGLKLPGEPASVRGDLARSRISVLDPASGAVSPRHLNPHIPYGVSPVPADVADRSLATPLGMAFSDEPDPKTLYVAAFGSGKIGVFDLAELDENRFMPDAASHIELGGGGPSGLVVSGGLLYVATRFDNSVRVIDASSGVELARHRLHDREPRHVVDGRRFLYDARLSSANGEASCSSCHIFGDMDDLAWDLGNPDDDQVANTNPFNPLTPVPPQLALFHPHKGPMTTQSLRGLANMGPQHWRGDRQGDEVAAFEAFNVAFPGLLGREAGADGRLSTDQMTSFRRFALELRYPPNPIRRLDNALRDPASGASELDGRDTYGAGALPGPVSDGLADCEGCHTVDAANGHFGGNGESTFDGLTQLFKVPHLRNMYQKVGMFGMQDVGTTDPPFGHLGPQVRGFGFSHDGGFDTVDRFLSTNPPFNLSAQQQADIEAFLMVFPTDLAPVVGQQVTLTASLLGGARAAEVNARADLLVARAGAAFSSRILGGDSTECDLVATLVEGGEGGVSRYLLQGDGSFLPDDGGPAIAESTLRDRATVAGQELTLTCVPPGSGRRMALDRDEDQVWNAVDSCPAAPNGPGGGTCTAGDALALGEGCASDAECGAGGACSLAQDDVNGNGIGDACDPILLPEPAAWLQLGSCLGMLFVAHRIRNRRRA